MVSSGFLLRIKKKTSYVIGLLRVSGGPDKNMLKDLNGLRYGHVCKESFFIIFFFVVVDIYITATILA